MASLKNVKMKIVGVGKTKQITKAMNMVASAKLRGAQSKIEAFRPYADKFQAIMQDLSSKSSGTAHPLLEKREEVKTVGILLITSDRGLCGGFNVNLINKALKLAREKEAQGCAVHFFCVGRKGRDAVHKAGFKILDQFVGAMAAVNFNLAMTVGTEIIHDFTEGKLDEVHMIYGEFVSLARQNFIDQCILPTTTPETEEVQENTVHAEYIYEPNVESLLGEMLPTYIKVQIFRGLLDTSASEHAARMTAMDNATRNCDEITDTLNTLYNKTRQSSITTDLIDIVSGADALKG